uniref:Putative rna-directed dna polymerase from mobile element jockey-like protein n=1 Tax=Ixodes ricinus TaxID=34613 RepID=A0A6B0V824_IXORI
MHHKALTVCSLYLPPSFTLKCSDFNSLLDQLPEPFLLMDDFNCHNPLWGSTRQDVRGKIVESVLTTRSLCLFNTGQPTYFSPSSLSSTSIDLSIGSAILLPDFSWSVDPNPRGSDHFPTLLTCSVAPLSIHTRPPRWKLDKADWGLFKQTSLLAHSRLDSLTIDELNHLLTERIITAAKLSIPQTSQFLPRRPKPWWNSECEETRKKQNMAWGILRRYPTRDNLISFRKMKARARYVRRKAKRESWQGYASTINSSTSPKEVCDWIHTINGSYHAFKIPLLYRNGACPGTLEEPADIFGEHFEYVSSSHHYPSTFLQPKLKAESSPLITPGGEHEG